MQLKCNNPALAELLDGAYTLSNEGEFAMKLAGKRLAIAVAATVEGRANNRRVVVRATR